MFKQLFVLFLVVMMFGSSMQQLGGFNAGGPGGAAPGLNYGGNPIVSGGPAGGVVGNGGGVDPNAAGQDIAGGIRKAPGNVRWGK